MKAPARRPVPIRLQRDIALRQLGEMMERLGFEAAEFELHHEPPLGLRPINPETGEHEPHQHNARYLVWVPKKEHRKRTTGRTGESDLSITFNGDVSRIAKARRLTKKQEEFRSRVLARDEGRLEPAPQIRRAWPKRQFPKARQRP